MLTSVLEETVVAIVNITLEALGSSNIGKVHQSWALGIVNTFSVDVAGVAELSWAGEAGVSIQIWLESFQDTLGTHSVVGAGGTKGWAEVALVSVDRWSQGSTTLLTLVIIRAEFAVLDITVEAFSSSNIGKVISTWAGSVD